MSFGISGIELRLLAGVSSPSDFAFSGSSTSSTSSSPVDLIVEQDASAAELVADVIAGR